MFTRLNYPNSVVREARLGNGLVLFDQDERLRHSPIVSQHILCQLSLVGYLIVVSQFVVAAYSAAILRSK